MGCGGCWMQYWSAQRWVFSKIFCCPSMYMHFRLAFLLCCSCQLFDFHKVLSVIINRSRSPATWEQPKTERSDQACVCAPTDACNLECNLERVCRLAAQDILENLWPTSVLKDPASLAPIKRRQTKYLDS